MSWLNIAPSTDPRAVDKSERIVIVGGGPAGLSTAYFLQKRGYHDVTVLEKAGRVGGLVCTHTERGIAFDLGANYTTLWWKETHRLAKLFGLKSREEGKWCYLDRDIDQVGPPQDEPYEFKPFLGTIVEEARENGELQEFYRQMLRFIVIRQAIAPWVSRPAFDKIQEWDDALASGHRPAYMNLFKDITDARLGVSFEEWLTNHGLLLTGPVFESTISVMGYGFAREVPAPHALRFMDNATIVPMALDRFPFIQRLFPKLAQPQRFELGFQTVWDLVARKVDVRTNVQITKIERLSDPEPGDTSEEDPVCVHYHVREQNRGALISRSGRLCADRLVFACLPSPDLFGEDVFHPTDFEELIAKNQTSITYCVQTMRTRGTNTDMAENADVALFRGDDTEANERFIRQRIAPHREGVVFERPPGDTTDPSRRPRQEVSFLPWALVKFHERRAGDGGRRKDRKRTNVVQFHTRLTRRQQGANGEWTMVNNPYEVPSEWSMRYETFVYAFELLSMETETRALLRELFDHLLDDDFSDNTAYVDLHAFLRRFLNAAVDVYGEDHWRDRILTWFTALQDYAPGAFDMDLLERELNTIADGEDPGDAIDSIRMFDVLERAFAHYAAREILEELGEKLSPEWKPESSERSWPTLNRWQYFKHMDVSHFARGFYQQLQEEQGRPNHRTYYIGHVTNMELVEAAVRHAKQLVNHHFAPSPKYTRRLSGLRLLDRVMGRITN